MASPHTKGYAGKFLRVDLTDRHTREETLDEQTLRMYVGGTGVGAKILYDEVAPEVEWSDPRNRLIIAQGPLGASAIGGSGSVSIVTKGPLTDGATSTQANGFFGGFLKQSGFDGIILVGASDSLLYLDIEVGTCELKSAEWLRGRDTYDTSSLIKHEAGRTEKEMSVLSIGPAGENLVKFAGIFVDGYHSASHNGVGAVMGSKKLKAIAVTRGMGQLSFSDKGKLAELSRQFLENVKTQSAALFRCGTLNGIVDGNRGGSIPIKNYTTNDWKIGESELERFSCDYLRTNYSLKRSNCWGCSIRHCDMFKITEGPYHGLVVEEPEYEQFAAWGPAIDVKDSAAACMLSREIDRLGMDTNEGGWLVAFVMECYEKGILTKDDLNGIEMKWGDAEATRILLNLIARREGIGGLLAEGVMRAAKRIGGEATDMAIHTLKGNSPRGHDHRTRWAEMFDTCVSSTSTIETHMSVMGPELQGPDMPIEISTACAQKKGWMQLEDSAVTCRFNTRMNVQLLSESIAAATGWDFTYEEGIRIGKRIVNLLRAFNIRNGIGGESDYPSKRYSSTPTNGPAAGKSILGYWPQMLQNYYRLMGWDTTGKPTPETLRQLGLGYIIPQIWSG